MFSVARIMHKRNTSDFGHVKYNNNHYDWICNNNKRMSKMIELTMIFYFITKIKKCPAYYIPVEDTPWNRLLPHRKGRELEIMYRRDCDDSLCNPPNYSKILSNKNHRLLCNFFDVWSHENNYYHASWLHIRHKRKDSRVQTSLLSSPSIPFFYYWISKVCNCI